MQYFHPDRAIEFYPPSPQLLDLLPQLSAESAAIFTSAARFPTTAQQLATARGALLKVQQGRGDWRHCRPGINRTVPGSRANITVRIFAPNTEVRGAMLHLHGGGWVFGEAAMMDATLAPLANALGIVIASVDYRLAPEHPYPAACDDCEDAALWYIDYCRSQYAIDNIVICGESAGAHLAAVNAIRMRQRHGYRYAGAQLAYGLYDFTNRLPSRTVADGLSLVQDSASCAYYANSFVPDPAMRDNPDVSPLFATLEDMPPALFSCASLDPFYDDSIVLYRRWLAAGNRAWLRIYQQAPHAFDNYAVPEGEHHHALGADFIDWCLQQ